MKAKIYYRNIPMDGIPQRATTKTIETDVNEPNAIVRKFIEETGKSMFTYIFHIRCGRYDYQWNDDASCVFKNY